MELYEKQPAVTRAMALALMRQAHSLLQAVNEDDAARHLQRAVDTLLRGRTRASVEPSEDA